jgi:2,3,4,5-tetrahydropyridine-2,6-dicarboxylate N-succinyltransferase
MTMADAFHALVKSVEAQPGYRRPEAFAIGIASFSLPDINRPGELLMGAKTLDTYFPVVNMLENFGTAALLAKAVGWKTGSSTHRLTEEHVDEALGALAPFHGDGSPHPNIEALIAIRHFLTESSETLVPRAAVVTFISDLSSKPIDAYDVYLRLHLLSHRKVKPHGVNLEGVFGLLNNVVWSNHGPFDPENFESVRARLRARGLEVEVRSVDKFPRMVDYVVPTGVRIADADRVRLGAHLAEGTTVMHEGFVNFNAGTLGKSMVEGRISAGVTVGNGSDIGGGASIMGTLSGGGKNVTTIGKDCLLGANSGLGISLGNNCTVEAGLYVTGGAKVRLPDGSIAKAETLSGQDDLLFRRNSQTGAIEVIAKKNQVVLNNALHAN